MAPLSSASSSSSSSSGSALRPAPAALAAFAGVALHAASLAAALAGQAPIAVVPAAARAELQPLLGGSWRLTTLEEALDEELKVAEAIVPDFLAISQGAALESALARLPSGKLVQLAMTGYDWLNLSSIPARFAVCNVHNAGNAIPEYVMAAVLAWNVRLPQLDAEFRRCTWHDGPNTCQFAPMHREAKGQTLGVIGYGTIGRGIAARAAALGMRVVAVDAHPPPGPPPSPLAWIGSDAELPRLAEEADFAVTSLPLSARTRGLVGEAFLAKMKPTAVLVNIGRGAVVDEASLFKALESKRLGGAVLDVWWQHFEQPSASWPSQFNFSALPNVWMTPHTSFNTMEAHKEGLRQVAANLDALAHGRPLANVVRGPSAAEGGAARVWEAEDELLV